MTVAARSPASVLLALPALLALVGLAGCGGSGERWLNLLFDDPPRPAAAAASPVSSSLASSTLAPAPADSLDGAQPPGARGGSTHAPSEAGACGTCHDLAGSTSFPGGGGWPGREPAEIKLPPTERDKATRLRVPRERLCAACHGDLEGETLARNHAVVHAPVASGGCTFCHDPHRSPFPKLLKSGDGPSLCGGCHDPAVSRRVCPQDNPRGGDCLACHLPHAAQRRGLLREEAP